MGWLSGPAGHSSAQAVIAQTLRNAVPERALQIAVVVGRSCGGWASGVLENANSYQHISGDLQRPPGNRASQRLRDHGLGARADS